MESPSFKEEKNYIQKPYLLRISWHVRTVALTLKRTEGDKRYHVSGVTCHLTCVKCRVLHVTCHMSLQTTAPATKHPPLFTVGWFTRTQKKQWFLFKCQESSKGQEHKKGLEICQYLQYTLQPEVSGPPGSRVSKRGHTDILTYIANYWLNRPGQIVSSKKFLRTSSSPHKTLPNDKYDAPKEVCGERKLFYRPLKKWGQKQFFDVRALTLCS